jgi:hypothetical protein
VNLKREMAENFFKLWIAFGLMCVRPGRLWITLCISIGQILKKKKVSEKDFGTYIRPPDSTG